MFKKTAVSLLLITAMLLLTSCSGGSIVKRFFSNIGSEMPNLRRDFGKDSIELSEEMFEKTINAVRNGDKSLLKSLFSKKALTESVEIDENIDYLFAFFEGDIKSQTRMGPETDGSIEYGHVITKISVWYHVVTEKQNYTFILIFYSEDTDHPDNIGLFALSLIKTENEDAEFAALYATETPGVYVPDANESQ